MATSAEIREGFRVFCEEIHRAEDKLEASVVAKVKKLESRIKMLENEVYEISGKPSVSSARPDEEDKPLRYRSTCMNRVIYNNSLCSGATYQSTSADARKLYGDIRPGDITHEKVQLRFVEFFSKTRRRFSSNFVTDTGTNYSHHQHLPCFLLQVSVM